jgi:hypothetical protein
MENVLMDMASAPDLAHALFRRINQFNLERTRRFLAANPGLFDVVGIGDDVAGQQALMMSPALWRELVTQTSRYARIKARDRLGAAVLLLQPALLAAVMAVVFPVATAPAVFMMALSSLWFGMSSSVRELIADRAIWRRERRVGARLKASPSYVAVIGSYGITYPDADGKDKPCIIGHCSVGSVERWIYTVLENALKMEKPALPFWLAPTQIRLLPVAADFIRDCEHLASAIHARVDIDDRDEKVGRKIRDAEKEWINMIIVVGDREKTSGKFPVRFRTGEVREFSIDELKAEVSRLQGDYPFDRSEERRVGKEC